MHEFDLQGLDSRSLEDLNRIVNFLHSSGLYSAEAALVREIEARFPDHVGSPRSSASAGSLPAEPQSLPNSPNPRDPDQTIDLCPSNSSPGPEIGILDSAEKVVEAWRSKSVTPIASPRIGSSTPVAAPTSPASPPKSVASPPTHSQSDIDQYEDDDDVGFWRIDIVPGMEGAAVDAYHGYSGGGEGRGPGEAECRASLLQTPSSSPRNYSTLSSRQNSLELPPMMEPVVAPGSHASPASMHQRHLSASSAPQLTTPVSGFSAGPPLSLDLNCTKQEGTAKWVMDTAQSAGSEAYRELMHFLDPSSPKYEGGGGVKDGQGREAGVAALWAAQGGSETSGPPSPGRERKHGALDLDGGIQSCKEREGDIGADDGNREVEADVGEGFRKGPVGRVSSLGEAILRVAAAAVEADMERECAEEEANQLEHEASATVSGSGVDLTGGMEPVVDLAMQQQRLPALKTPFADASLPPVSEHQHQAQHAQQQKGGEALVTEDGDVLEEPRSPQQQHLSDPFSFPVTSPSEKVAPVPAPLFGSGSWPSFKNLTPEDKRAMMYGYNSGNEDDTGSRQRSMQRPPRAASSIARAGPFNPQTVKRSSSYMALVQHQGFNSANNTYHGSMVSTPQFTGQQYDDLALYEYDQQYIANTYEVMDLKVIHRAHTTGFQHTRELPLRVNDLIAGRYQILDLLGQAAFSRAVQALDLKTGALVCLKVVKNNKDYFDQSLDEIRLLRYVNECDPNDEHGVIRLYDFFYFKEHLFLVCELLRANLYEFAKYNRESGEPLYFTPDRVASVACQILRSLAYIHSLGLVHADLKPENILMKSYSQCVVKVIDLGSSCYVTDPLSPYVQSRSYRAPEVILGVPYDQKIDVWSLGCIVAELLNGRVLFQNVSLPSLLARMEGILGPMPQWMMHRGKFTSKFYNPEGRIYETKRSNGQMQYLRPKKTSLAKRIPEADPEMIDFLTCLLQVDPTKRPSAAEALHHPWLQRVGASLGAGAGLGGNYEAM